MSLLQLVRVEVGEVGILPGTVKMVSTDNLATITTAGYLNGTGNQLSAVSLAPTDVIECIYSYDNITGSCSYAVLKPSISGGVITLSQAGGGSVTPAALTRVNDTNVTLTLGGTPSTALLQATSLTLGWTGVLSGTRGGTGVNNGSSTMTIGGNFTMSGAFTFTGNLSGNTNITYPTSGTLATTSQLPSGAALTKVDDTNVTLTLGGTPSTALLQSTSLTLGWTGELSVARGGTGLSSATAYAVLCGGTTSTGAFQSVVSVGSAGQVLTSNGAGALPTFQAAGGGGGVPLGADTGALNAYACTGISGFTSTSLAALDGFTFTFVPGSTNTSTLPTINVNSLGASGIVRSDNSSLRPGDMSTFVPAVLTWKYNFGNWVLVNPASTDQNPFWQTISSNTNLVINYSYVCTTASTLTLPGGGGANTLGGSITIFIDVATTPTINISTGGTTVRFLNNTGTNQLTCTPGSGTPRGHFITLTNTSFGNWGVTNYSGSASDWTLT